MACRVTVVNTKKKHDSFWREARMDGSGSDEPDTQGDELQMSDSEKDDSSEVSEDEEVIGDVVTLSAGHFETVELITLTVACNKSLSQFIKLLCRKLVKKFSPGSYNPHFHLWTLKISDPIDDSGLSDDAQIRKAEYSNDPIFCTVPESERDPTLAELNLSVGSRLVFRYDGGHVFSRNLRVLAIGAPDSSVVEPPLNAPLFSVAEMEQSQEARWLASRDGPDYTIRWGDDEMSVMRLLILAGFKFARAWDHFLENVFLFRSRGATSSTTAVFLTHSCLLFL
jgi:hypothetical protein